ncbi:hypothetical protein GGTG_11688 [Gaeumannomyces tritici R3-111a-1]|uniref:IRG-type G domain-containing protein n=1 Tax=Gaeumannomyces tritici (strain R3-111a-1) TaxID=644352 RepID=J3PDW5_GAET3|nr:hypothetical protein GGTG_11688 [Gaeumannomyces tritici R3-111a-1]EJT70665.1 hypothetical protein GGTG_11688 [Gaeumannomyces tritici R3-111a-1]
MSRGPPTFIVGARYDHYSGALIVVPALLGAALLKIPITPAVLAAAAPPVAAGIYVVGSIALNVAALAAGPLRDWVTSSRRAAAAALASAPGIANNPESTRVSHERIAEERQGLDFELGATHIAVCGVAGSGKSSIVNALRGLTPTAPGAAATGNAETTTARAKYATHPSIQGSTLEGIFLHDLPGSGTVRVTAIEYYRRMKLYLFDHVFVVQGARFGETDAEIIRSCVIQGQMFTIIRGQMDTLINNKIQDSDDTISDADAKESVRAECADAVVNEMQRAGLPLAATESLLPRYALVNRQDLRRLAIQDPAMWPQPRGPTEMMERELLKALGKASISDDVLGVA